MANAERETFIKVNDHMIFHPKIEGLSDKAFRAVVTLWCWCSVSKTDGHVPAGTWKLRAPGKVGRELIAAGLAHESPDGGADMHDYLKHQRSLEHIEAVSKKRAAAGQRGGKVRAERKQSAKHVANQPASNEQATSTPEDRGGTSYLPDRETDSAPSERPADAGAPPGDPPDETPAIAETAEKLTEIKRAQEITKAYVERVPLSRFPAVLGIVRKAVQSGRYGDEQISEALIRLAAEGRAVTVDSLRYELDGQPPPRQQQSRPSKATATIAGLQARKTGTDGPPPARALERGET